MTSLDELLLAEETAMPCTNEFKESLYHNTVLNVGSSHVKSQNVKNAEPI